MARIWAFGEGSQSSGCRQLAFLCIALRQKFLLQFPFCLLEFLKMLAVKMTATFPSPKALYEELATLLYTTATYLNQIKFIVKRW